MDLDQVKKMKVKYQKKNKKREQQTMQEIKDLKNWVAQIHLNNNKIINKKKYSQINKMFKW